MKCPAINDFFILSRRCTYFCTWAYRSFSTSCWLVRISCVYNNTLHSTLPWFCFICSCFCECVHERMFFFFCSRPQYLPVNLPGCFISNVNRLVIYTTAFSHQLPVLRSCPDTQSSDHSFAELHTFLQLSPAYFSNVSSALRWSL